MGIPQKIFLDQSPRKNVPGPRGDWTHNLCIWLSHRGRLLYIKANWYTSTWKIFCLFFTWETISVISSFQMAFGVQDSNYGTPNLFWKEVYSERKYFAPKGSKFFPVRVDPFQKGDNTLLTEVSPLQNIPSPKLLLSITAGIRSVAGEYNSHEIQFVCQWCNHN